jgi:molybdopterin/thiamine biosynthesis adenylyltransferase
MSALVEPVLNFASQFKLFDVVAARPVTLIGVGAAGSYSGVAMAKMGVRLIMAYDGDNVESQNGPVSRYRLKDLARPKVYGLREIIEEEAGIVIDARYKHYEEEPLCDYVVCCVDTIKARQLVWKNVQLRKTEVDILIDVRIAGELLWVLAIDPDDVDDAAYYEHHLSYTDADVTQFRCGNDGIVYSSLGAAKVVCANLSSWLQHGKKKLHHKELTGALEFL